MSGVIEISRFNRLTFAIVALAALNLAVVWIYAQLSQPEQFRLRAPINLLILAAHQDDAVIQAGGLAIQNANLGGNTHVAYLTLPADPLEAEVRRRESLSVWKRVPNSQLAFLGLTSGVQWRQQEIEGAKRRIRELVRVVDADVVSIPLAEGGHPEHDALNALATEVLAGFDSVKVLQASEYNSYYWTERSPGKILGLLQRLLPLSDHVAPTFGIDTGRQLRLAMTDAELAKKRSMLRGFTSQAAIIPISQFGHPDVFEVPGPGPLAITVAGKTLSAWSMATLLLVYGAVFTVGLATGLNVRPLRLVAVLLVLTLSLLFPAAALGPKPFLEEWTFPAVFTLGLLASLPLSRFRS